MRTSFGIKDGYPRIRRRLGVKVSAYIQLVRPLTLLAPILGGLAGGLMGYKSVFATVPELLDKNSWMPIVYATASLLFVQMGNNILNQACEVELDRKAKPFRPIPTGLVGKDEALALCMILYTFALSRSALVSEIFSILMVALVVLTITYSMKPIYLKSRLWLGNLNLGVARGALGFLATFSVYGDPFSFLPLSIAFILGIFVFGANSTKDFADRKADAEFGIRTLSTVYGETARLIIAPFFITPYPIIWLFIQLGVMPRAFLLLTILAPLSMYAVYTLVKEPWRQLSITENTLSWVLMYLQLSGLLTGFAVLYLFLA